MIDNMEKQKAADAIKHYKESINIFQDAGADFEAAMVKVDLANFKRRVLQQFTEAKKILKRPS